MESPEVLNEVGDFCKSLVSQNKYIACQRHMLDCLIPVLVQVSLRIKPKTLQPKHSQYKRTPCLISSTFRWTSLSLAKMFFNLGTNTHSGTSIVNWRLPMPGRVPLYRICTFTQSFYKASKRKPSHSLRLKSNANFTTWNWPPTNVRTTIARNVIGWLSWNVGEITRRWAAGYYSNKICSSSLWFIQESQISASIGLDWQTINLKWNKTC